MLLFHLKKNIVIFPFLSILSRFKRMGDSGIIYNVMNWVAYISRCFVITQKSLYITSSNFVGEVIHN